jgi:hypothetical protein
LAGDRAERATASDGSDHSPAAGGLTVSLVRSSGPIFGATHFYL